MRPWYCPPASALFCATVSAMARPALTLETLQGRAATTPAPTPMPTDQSRRQTTSTPYAVPLTTTFTPPDSCNAGHLTQLGPPGYFIWLNEPVPVQGTTVSDCYPSEFLEYYSTYRVDATFLQSRVPMMSPLVCPFDWNVVSEQGDYQACCPNGYNLAAPKTLLDPKRPAYGGTCYSDWELSSTAFVDVYGSASSSGRALVTATSLPFQAYAHVIDGIAMTTSSSQSSDASSPPSSSPSPANSSNSSRPGSLQAGAIAGIVIGVVGGLALLAVAGLVMARRRRRMDVPPAPPPKDPRDDMDLSTVRSPTMTDGSIGSPSAFKRSHTAVSEMAAGEFHIHELEAGGKPIEKP